MTGQPGPSLVAHPGQLPERRQLCSEPAPDGGTGFTSCVRGAVLASGWESLVLVPRPDGACNPRLDSQTLLTSGSPTLASGTSFDFVRRGRPPAADAVFGLGARGTAFSWAKFNWGPGDQSWPCGV